MPCRAGGPRRWLRSALCRSRGSERTVPPVRTGTGALLSVFRFWRRPLGLPAGSSVFGSPELLTCRGRRPGAPAPLSHRARRSPAPVPFRGLQKRPPPKEGRLDVCKTLAVDSVHSGAELGLAHGQLLAARRPSPLPSARGQRGFASAAPPGVMCRKGRQMLVGAAGRKVDFGKMFSLLLTLTMMSFLTAFCKLGTITLPLTSEKEGFGQCRVLFK